MIKIIFFSRCNNKVIKIVNSELTNNKTRNNNNITIITLFGESAN
jgi:hypothetical protein